MRVASACFGMAALALRAMPALAQSSASVWDLNGSEMSLTAAGANREIHYQVVRPGLQEAGVQPGTLWFKGVRSGDQYVGTAYVFSQSCGAIPYSVVASVSADGQTITVHGSAPTVEAPGCAIAGYHDTADSLHLLGNRTTGQEIVKDRDYGDEGRLFSAGKDEYFLLSRAARSGEGEGDYIGQVRVLHNFSGGGYEILMKDYVVACTGDNGPAITWFKAGDHGLPVTITATYPDKHPPENKKESYNLYWAVCHDKFNKFR